MTLACSILTNVVVVVAFSSHNNKIRSEKETTVQTKLSDTSLTKPKRKIEISTLFRKKDKHEEIFWKKGI